nr:signal peptidase I [Microlunatus antarcticus]
MVGVAVLLLAGLLWRLDGGSWAVIETGSMGSAAPVGTLILTRREPTSAIVVGDVVSYHPRTNPKEIITHRVVEKLSDGTLRVRGDINGAADPYPVRDIDLVGTVEVTLIGLGWVVKALPMLVVAGAVLLVASQRYIRAGWRSSVRVLGTCLLLCLAVLILRPFVHPVLISVRTPPGGQAEADVVSGGLLPTRVEGMPGHHVDLLTGQVGSVAVAAPEPGAPFHIVGHPHLDLPWMIVVSLVCSLPLLWCLVVGLSPDEDAA